MLKRATSFVAACFLASSVGACLFPDYTVTNKSLCTSSSPLSKCMTSFDGWDIVRLFDRDATCPEGTTPPKDGPFFGSSITDPTSCTHCQCGGKAECKLDQVDFTQGSCGGPPCSAQPAMPPGTTCVAFTNTEMCDSVKVSVEKIDHCIPTGGDVTNHDPANTICSVNAPGRGCADDEVCSDIHACYMQPGNVLFCPAEGYEPSLVYQLSKPRACSECTCSATCGDAVFLKGTDEQGLCNSQDQDPCMEGGWTPNDVGKCASVNAAFLAVKLCATPTCLPHGGVGAPPTLSDPYVLCCPTK